MKSGKLIAILVTAAMIVGIGIGTKAQQEDMQEVVSWMYENGLTIYSTAQTFKTASNIRRDETAKLISVFAQSILDQEGQEDRSCYGFTDVSSKNTMKVHITQACELGYMKGSNRKFNPTGNLTNQQAIAITIRMYEGRLDEPKSDRSVNYYARAEELGLLEGMNLYTKTDPISRGEFATLLYRLGKNNEETSMDDFGAMMSGGMEMLAEQLIAMLGLKVNSQTGLTIAFINQAAECISGAKVTIETNFDMMLMTFNIKHYKEIRGLQGGKCMLYERMEDVKIHISSGQNQSLLASGMTQAEIDVQLEEMQEQTNEIIGKDGICMYSTGDLVTILQQELSGEKIGTIHMTNTNGYCTGLLYE